MDASPRSVTRHFDRGEGGNLFPVHDPEQEDDPLPGQASPFAEGEG